MYQSKNMKLEDVRILFVCKFHLDDVGFDRNLDTDPAPTVVHNYTHLS